MSLRFHWFLPTNGDGRDIVGGGHGVATGAAGAIRPPSVEVPGPDRPQRRAARLRGRAHPDRRLVRGRLAHLRDAHRGDRAAEVPGRVPPRPDQPHPLRPDGRPPSSASRTAGCCSTSSPAASRPSSAPTATSSTRTSATSAPGSSSTSSRRLWRGETVTTARQAPAASRARSCPGCPTRSPTSTSAARARPRARSPRRYSDVYLTWGEPPSAVNDKLRWIEALAGRAEGRTLRLGIRLHTISRDTSRGGLAAGRLPHGARHRRHDRQGPVGPGDQRVGGPAADARAARQRRPPRPARPRDLPEPLGRRRPGPRRRRHRPWSAATRRSPT